MKRLLLALSFICIFAFQVHADQFGFIATPDGTGYSFTTLSVAGASTVVASAINNSGQVLGGGSMGPGFFSFVYQGGVYMPLSVPGATQTQGQGLNDLGQVVGFYLNGSGHHGFLYNAGSYTTLSVPGSTQTDPQRINDSGIIIGSYLIGSAIYGFMFDGINYTTFSMPGAISTSPIDINASGQVAGSYRDLGSNNHGFIYSNGSYTTIDPPGPINTNLIAINTSGEVVGNGSTSPFFYSGGTYTNLDSIKLGPNELNDRGDVVGFSPSDSQASIYSSGLYSTLAPPGSVFSSAFGINNDGQVVGFYTTPPNIIVPTPEVPTLGLLIIGIVGTVGFSWRRRNIALTFN